MKKLILSIALCVLTTTSFAQSSASPSTTTTTTATTNSAATNQGNAQAITFTSPDVQTIRNVPSVSGPMLTTSNDTCMGSSSGSANGPGFGVSIGSTWVDKNCVILKNSREMWSYGMKAAALALMCKDTDNREALELTGFECPQTTRERKNADQLKMSSTLGHSTPAPFAELTDPFIRARLGLAPL